MRLRLLKACVSIGLGGWSAAYAQTCQQKAVLTATADVYREAPRYVTGLGWQGVRTDRVLNGTVVWVCQDRAVDFGFSSKTWSQIGYRPVRSTEPWRFGWILKSQWRAAAREPGRQSRADAALRLASYTDAAPTAPRTRMSTEVPPEAPPEVPPDLPRDLTREATRADASAPDNPDTPPNLPASKSGNGAVADTPPDSVTLSEQIVLYGPLFIAMLLGMLAKALFDLLDDARPSWREHLRHGAMAIVISPIVFLGFITAGQFGGSSQTFLVLALFAFQNGFFWQTVLKRSPPLADKAAPSAP